MSTMLSPPRPRAKSSWFSSRELIISVVTTTPAVRMFFVSVGYIDEPKSGQPLPETYTEFQPVVAIQTKIVDCWNRRDDSEADHERERRCRYSTANELREAGYRFERRDVDHSPLVIIPDFEAICSTDDFDGHISYQKKMPVAATWPIDQDDARLTAIANEMLAELRPAADREVTR